MHDRATMLAVTLLVIMGAVATTALALSVEDRAQPDDSYGAADLPGHWYLVEGQQVNAAGDYRELAPETDAAAALGISILYEHSGLFYGYLGSLQFAGTYDDGLLEIQQSYAAEGGTCQVWMHGAMIGSSAFQLNEVTTLTDEAGTVTEVTVSHLVYSRDSRAAVALATSSPNLSGVWQCAAVWRYTAEEAVAEAPVGNLALSDRGYVTNGILSDPIGGAGTTAAVVGSSLYQGAAVGNAELGLLCDATGTYWYVQYGSSSLTLWTFVDDGSGIVCYCREYTRSGSGYAAQPPLALNEVTWNCTAVQTIETTSVTETACARSFTSVARYGNLCFGTISDNGKVSTCAGVFTAGTPVRGELYLNPADGASVWATGLILSDSEAVVTEYRSEGVSRVICEPVLDQYELTGHWNMAHISAYGANGRAYTNVDTQSLMLVPYNIEITKVAGQTFWGSFEGTYITGSVEGNVLCFNVNVDLGHAYVVGTVINQRTMIAAALTYDDATGQYASWCNVLTKSYTGAGTAPLLDPEYDYSGNWLLYSGQTFNGETGLALVGTHLTIAEIKGNLFTGKMEQMSGTAVIERTVREVIYENDGRQLTGMLIDSSGKMWDVSLDKTTDQLRIIGLNVSQVAAFEGQIICSLRCYSRDGTGEAPTPVHQIAGTTWKAVAREVMTAEGKYTTSAPEVVITVGTQNGVQFGCLANDDGYLVPVVGWIDGDTVMAVAKVGTATPDWAHGWYADGRIWIVSYSHDVATGQYLTMVTEYKEVAV